VVLARRALGVDLPLDGERLALVGADDRLDASGDLRGNPFRGGGVRWIGHATRATESRERTYTAPGVLRCKPRCDPR